MTDTRFWMVWNMSGEGIPWFQHFTEESAEVEAERLARKCPGQKFIVLEAKSLRMVDDMVRVSFGLSDAMGKEPVEF